MTHITQSQPSAELPEPAGVVLDFNEDGTAIVDHACEGPTPSLKQHEVVYSHDQLLSALAARDAKWQVEVEKWQSEYNAALENWNHQMKAAISLKAERDAALAEVTKLQDRITELTSEEHSIPELRQMLQESFEEKQRAWFAIRQLQLAVKNTVAERDAALVEVENQRKAADHWMGETNKEHNDNVRLEAELAALKGEQ